MATCLLSLFVDEKGEGVQEIIERGLEPLLLKAYASYCKVVILDGYSYERFAWAFVREESVLVLYDEPAHNNIAKLKVLFGDLFDIIFCHHSLVCDYFSRAQFSLDDCRDLLSVFYGGKAPARIFPQYSNDSALCLEDEDYRILVDCANRIGLFKESLDISHLKAMLWGQEVQPLHSTNNNLVTFFYAQLYKHGLLPRNWQITFERKRYIISSDSRHGFITAKSYSSMKNKLLERNPCHGQYYHIIQGVEKVVSAVSRRANKS